MTERLYAIICIIISIILFIIARILYKMYDDNLNKGNIYYKIIIMALGVDMFGTYIFATTILRYYKII